MRRIINRIIASILVASFIVVSPIGNNLKALAKEDEVYISEIVLSYGKTEDDARKWLTKNGYKVVEGDLNKGAGDGGLFGSSNASTKTDNIENSDNSSSKEESDSDKNVKKDTSESEADTATKGAVDDNKKDTPKLGEIVKKTVNVVLMGYKTTTNKMDAITDISLMKMTGGFKITDMDIILEKQKEMIDENYDKIISLAAEYQVNYKEAVKSKAKGELNHANALRAHDLLNKYTEDDLNKGMGDVFLLDFSETTNKEMLRKIIVQANPIILSVLKNMLALAGGDKDGTWISDMSDLNENTTFFERVKKDLKTNNRAKNYLDKEYGDYAEILRKEIRDVRERIIEEEKITADIMEKYGTEEITADMINEYFGIDNKDSSSKETEAAETEEASKETEAEENAEEKKAQDSEEKKEADDETAIDEAKEEAEKETEVLKDDKVSYNEKINIIKAGLNDADKAAEAAKYMETVAVSLYLCNYKYAGERLYDFFKEDRDYSDDDDKYEIYAVLEAMTEPQRDLLSDGISLFTSIKYAMTGEEEVWSSKNKKYIEENDERIEEIEKTSIYMGVNRHIFEGKVGITSLADTRNADIAFDVTRCVLSSVGILSGTVLTTMGVWIGIKAGTIIPTLWEKTIIETMRSSSGLVGKIYKCVYATILKHNYPQFYESLDQILQVAINGAHDAKTGAEIDIGSLYSDARHYRDVAYKVTMVIGIVIALAGIVISGISIWELVESVKDYYDGDYSVDIPEFMVDVSDNTDLESDYIYYEVCKCNRNDSDMKGIKADNKNLKDFGDVNGDSGRYWVAMYTTKDYNAGKPILADSLEVKYGDVAFDEEYKQVHMFDEYSGANITSVIYNYFDKEGGTYIRYKESNTNLSGSALNANNALQKENKSAASQLGSIIKSKHVNLAFLLGIAFGGICFAITGVVIRKKKGKK